MFCYSKKRKLPYNTGICRNKSCVAGDFTKLQEAEIKNLPDSEHQFVERVNCYPEWGLNP